MKALKYNFIFVILALASLASLAATTNQTVTIRLPGGALIGNSTNLFTGNSNALNAVVKVNHVDASGAGMAIGNACTASGTNSAAIGISCLATNEASIAMGFVCIAGGPWSFAAGYDNYALGTASTALGGYSFATNNYSFTWSDSTENYYSHGTNTFNVHAYGGIFFDGGPVTVSGSVLTTNDQIATPPSEYEFVTAGWARNVLASGRAIYMTTNLYPATWGPTNTTGIGSYENGTEQWVSFAVTGVNHYVATMVDTNVIPANTPLGGPATARIHLFTRTGSPAGNYAFSAKPELYYTYNLSDSVITNGDFDTEAQAWTPGVTNANTFTISWPTVIPTNNYYRVFRLKCTVKGSSTTNIVMGIGGTVASFVQMQDVAAGNYVATVGGTASNLSVNGTATLNGMPIATTVVTNSPSTLSAVAVSTTNTLSYANGNLQLFIPTNACVIALPAISGAATQYVHSIRLELVAGTNAITCDTNNVTGWSGLTIYTNTTTSILFDAAWGTTNWRASQL